MHSQLQHTFQLCIVAPSGLFSSSGEPILETVPSQNQPLVYLWLSRPE